jgi:hypothetical protein
MSANYRFDTDVKEALAMAEGLADYVRGSELYGRTGGGFFSQMPSLTVGALVMRLRRLHDLRLQLDDRMRERLDRAAAIYEQTRRDWRLHYEEKATHEAHSRIDAMATFFRECSESPANAVNIYRPELLRRTIVQELLHELEDLRITDENLQTKVRGADSRLRSVLRPAGFQWAQSLMAVYPEKEYWWLYQAPPADAEK